MGQMAVQGTIYNKAVWAGPPGGLAQTQAEALLWGLEGGMGSCNPGTVVAGGGLICSPDSFMLKESRMPAWRCSVLELPGM